MTHSWHHHLVILSLLAAALSLAFGAVVAGRWRQSRRTAFAWWAVGLLIFAAAAAVQAAGQRWGFSEGLFRAFYLLGGILGVAYLALGTVWLMASPRWARVTTGGLLLLTAAAVVAASTAPVDAAQLATSRGVLGDAFTGSSTALVRGLAALLNAGGTLILVGGSAWSGWRFWQQRLGLDRVICNALLTAGALVVALGLTVARLVGDAAGGVAALGAFEAAGIGIMFAGFLSLGRVGAGNRVR